MSVASRKRSYSLSHEQLDELDDDLKPIIHSQKSTSTFSSNSEPGSKRNNPNPKLDSKPTAHSSPAQSKIKAEHDPGTKVKKEASIAPARGAKATFAEIIVEAGLRGYDKALVEAETGLTKSQQGEMLKKGRGSLWKALYGFAAGL